MAVLNRYRIDIQQNIVSCLAKNFNKNSQGIINIHRLNTQNSGDLMCAPYLYFNELQQYEKLDIVDYLSLNPVKSINWVKKVTTNDIVLGGGGLLDRDFFEKSISVFSHLASKGKKIALWGVGHNNASLQYSQRLIRQISKFDLVGIRDTGIKNTEWVPCVSCMNDIFDKDYKVENEIGVIVHEHIGLDTNIIGDFPSIKNSVKFEDIVGFIGKTEVLITNSYHAMYWAMLLNRKVVVVPNSSKMLSFKYKPSLCYDIKDYKKAVKEAVVYTGLKEECRKANVKFSEKVFNYLNI